MSTHLRTLSLVAVWFLALVGGVLYLGGALIMAYNLWMTVRRAPLDESAPATAAAE